MRNLRPALPVVILLLSGSLGVPAGSAQSKGAAKKKPSAAKSSAASPKGSAAASPAGKKNSATIANGKSATRNATSRAGGKKGSARSRRQPGQKAPSSERVSEIQTALAKDGSFPGSPNGKWDDDTVQAMRKFQASHGLSPTGKLDALSLQKLGLGSQTAGVAAPTPPPGAVSRLSSSVILPSSSETDRQQ